MEIPFFQNPNPEAPFGPILFNWASRWNPAGCPRPRRKNEDCFGEKPVRQETQSFVHALRSGTNSRFNAIARHQKEKKAIPAQFEPKPVFPPPMVQVNFLAKVENSRFFSFNADRGGEHLGLNLESSDRLAKGRSTMRTTRRGPVPPLNLVETYRGIRNQCRRLPMPCPSKG